MLWPGIPSRNRGCASWGCSGTGSAPGCTKQCRANKKTCLPNSTRCTELLQELSAFDLGPVSSAYSPRVAFGQAEAFTKQQLLLCSSPRLQSLLGVPNSAAQTVQRVWPGLPREGLPRAPVPATDVTLRVDRGRRRGWVSAKMTCETGVGINTTQGLTPFDLPGASGLPALTPSTPIASQSPKPHWRTAALGDFSAAN